MKMKKNFDENLKIINNQIKQIGNLVNEFSDFARMPKPILKQNNLIKIIEDDIKLLNELDNTINIFMNTNKKKFLNSDKEQLARVFFNLIKNLSKVFSKTENDGNLEKKITIEFNEENNHIIINIIDNGVGLEYSANIKDILNHTLLLKKMELD